MSSRVRARCRYEQIDRCSAAFFNLQWLFMQRERKWRQFVRPRSRPGTLASPTGLLEVPGPTPPYPNSKEDIGPCRTSRQLASPTHLASALARKTHSSLPHGQPLLRLPVRSLVREYSISPRAIFQIPLSGTIRYSTQDNGASRRFPSRSWCDIGSQTRENFCLTLSGCALWPFRDGERTFTIG